MESWLGLNIANDQALQIISTVSERMYFTAYAITDLIGLNIAFKFCDGAISTHPELMRLVASVAMREDNSAHEPLLPLS